MATIPSTPDAVDLAGRYAAQACGRHFESNPMMWRDVGAMLIAALMEPEETATRILATDVTPTRDE